VYAYHATVPAFLAAIRKEGLRPQYHESAGEDVIFCEPDLALIEPYVEPGGIVLRWPADNIAGSTPDGECVWYDPVPPERLQIRTRDGRWIPLM
jgi:hypothetical protein